MRRVALVSREVFPFGGGGIGEYVTSCAELLSQSCEVAIFTTSVHEPDYWRLRMADDARMPPRDVDVIFVDEPNPDEIGSFFSHMHLYSARTHDALRAYYDDHGPDLIEFSDYLGEGAVTAQARRGGSDWLRRTKVGIRIHTTAQICAVLDGYVDAHFGSEITFELERLALRDADVVLWPGGDTLSFYRGYYGADALAPGFQIRNPMRESRPSIPLSKDPIAAGPLQLLYLGRLERRKGVQNLVRAISMIDSTDLRLTLLGGDTATAPLGTSLAAQLELMAAGDGRIVFAEPIPRAQLADAITACDAVTLPSLWEAWPYVGLEALRLNRPLLATPVGAFTELVRPGASGWLTRDTTAAALATTIEKLISDRQHIESLTSAGLPAKTFEDLTRPDEIVGRYEDLFAASGRWNAALTTVRGSARTYRAFNGSVFTEPAPDNHEAGQDKDLMGSDSESWTALAPLPERSEVPLVSVIIPYFRLSRYVEDAVASACIQTHQRTEVLIVNDGSFGSEDWVLGELSVRYPVSIVTQMNAGLGAARNLGISQARGKYVLPLDADNVLEPCFIQRAVEILEEQPEVAFVTSWSQYIDVDGTPFSPPASGYAPLGNYSPLVHQDNVAGDAVAVMRKWLFDLDFQYSQDLASYEDWHLYQRLHDAGHYGIALVERLVKYRVRGDSMIRDIGLPLTGRLAGEMRAHSLELTTRWKSAKD